MLLAGSWCWPPANPGSTVKNPQFPFTIDTRGMDAPWGPASTKGRGTVAHMALPGPVCYQTCLRQLIRANWLFSKSSLQERCKKDFEAGPRVAKPLFKHTALRKDRLPAPVSLPVLFSTDVNRLKSCWMNFTSH